MPDDFKAELAAGLIDESCRQINELKARVKELEAEAELRHNNPLLALDDKGVVNLDAMRDVADAAREVDDLEYYDKYSAPCLGALHDAIARLDDSQKKKP